MWVPINRVAPSDSSSWDPQASADDLDLDPPDGLDEFLDRWPCRALVERRGVDGSLMFGILSQPVARRLHGDASEDELAAYLQARVAEAEGEPRRENDALSVPGTRFGLVGVCSMSAGRSSRFRLDRIEPEGCKNSDAA